MNLKGYRFPDEKLILDFRKEGQHRNYRDTKARTTAPVKLPKFDPNPDYRSNHLSPEWSAYLRSVQDNGADPNKLSARDYDKLMREYPQMRRHSANYGEKMYPEWVDALLGYFR